MNIRVHTTHCCPKCGCKYGHEDCPVAAGRYLPEYDCEVCEEIENDWKTDERTIELQRQRDYFLSLIKRAEPFLPERAERLLIEFNEVIKEYK